MQAWGEVFLLFVQRHDACVIPKEPKPNRRRRQQEIQPRKLCALCLKAAYQYFNIFHREKLSAIAIAFRIAMDLLMVS
jgi:hypothetical protein